MRRSGSLLRDFTLSRRAASAVEFALVAPVFILTLVGITVYGLYFGTALSVSQLAAEAARASIAGISDSERVSLATTRATQFVSGSGLLKSGRVTVVAAPNETNAEVFDVEVSYDASNLPIYAFASLVPVPSPVIVRKSSIQRGGF